jgi:hypothetical protein
MVDSAVTSGKGAVNFCCSNNRILRICFATSCVYRLFGTCSAGLALVEGCLRILVLEIISSMVAYGFNKLGKYTLTMENFINKNFINVTKIAQLMN